MCMFLNSANQRWHVFRSIFVVTYSILVNVGFVVAGMDEACEMPTSGGAMHFRFQFELLFYE